MAKKDPKNLKKQGRPTLYTPELADEICEAVATNACGLTTLIKAHPHWPVKANIYIWLRKYQSFRDHYTRAKEEQVEVSVDLMQEMMDDEHHFQDDKGQIRIDVQMLRVKVDAIKWQAGKLKPKKYGEGRVEEQNNALLEESTKLKHELDEKNRKAF